MSSPPWIFCWQNRYVILWPKYCRTSVHHWDYHSHALSLIQVTAFLLKIGHPETWRHDRVPGHYSQQGPPGDMPFQELIHLFQAWKGIKSGSVGYVCLYMNTRYTYDVVTLFVPPAETEHNKQILFYDEYLRVISFVYVPTKLAYRLLNILQQNMRIYVASSDC